MKIVILTPVFNDWESLRHLLSDIDRIEFHDGTSVQVMVVNDGSTVPMPSNLIAATRYRHIGLVTLLDLACNLGHQRAIALGIAAIAADEAVDLVVVMDCDGEDDPRDVIRLVDRWLTCRDAIVVAERAKRQETLRFRLGYGLYKTLFLILVGHQISFGNFCAFGHDVARRLASTPDTWNHLAATLLRSRLSIVPVPANRAARYAGTASSGTTLVAHGLSALAVFSDRIFARLLLLSALLGGMAILGTFIVVGIRMMTDFGIPGWATTAVGALAIMIVQAVILSLIASVLLLASRSQASAIPASLVDIFVRERRVIHTDVE